MPLDPEDNLAGCILVDTSNGFNNLSRLEMICTVAHRWQSTSIFAFNYYRHFSHLIIRVLVDWTLRIILTRYGVMQGDPMDTLMYGISVKFLEEKLISDTPGSMQVYYIDNLSATAICRYTRPLMKRLLYMGPSRGVFPKAEKYQYF